MSGKPTAGDISGDDTLAAVSDVESDDHDAFVEVDADHYRIGDEIARGGMGRIMDARDRRAGRPVAIKEVLVELLRHFPDADKEVLVRRFQREARITAGLQHPAIVPVYEIGRFGDAPFFSMKKVDGRPLDEVIDDCDGIEERLGVLPKLIAIAEALAYAHERGVIHRDLKPANVLVGAHGETVVIDWGLAKQLDDIEATTTGPPVVGRDGLETVVGSVFGTPLYMPPEQAEGRETDQRADVYAIGAMLYHLLAGHPPYRDRLEKASAAAVLDALLEGPPTPLAALDEDIPADLISITARAMARDRDDRYDNASGLAADLRQLQAGKLVAVHDYSIGELISRWVRRHRAAVATAIVALVAVTGLTVLGFMRIANEAERANAAARKAKANEQEAIDILTAGGRLALWRGDVTDSAFRLTQARKRGGRQIGLPILLAGIEASIDDRVVRIGGDDRIDGAIGHPDPAFFGLIYQSSRVELRSSETGAVRASLQLDAPISDVSFDAAGRRALVVYGLRSHAELWDLERGIRLHELGCPRGLSPGGKLMPDGEHIIIACAAGSLNLYQAESGELVSELPARVALERIDVSVDSSLVTTTLAGLVSQYTIEPLALVRKVLLVRGGPLAVEGDASHHTLAAIRLDGTIVVHDFARGANLEIPAEASSPWSDVAMSADDSAILAVRGDDRAIVFDRDGKKRSSVIARGLAIATISQDGSRLATVGADSAVRIWETETGRLISEHLGLSRPSLLRWVRPDRLVAVDTFTGGILIKITDRTSSYRTSDRGFTFTRFGPSSNALLASTEVRTLFFRDPGAAVPTPVDLGRRAFSSLLTGVFAAGVFATAEGVHDAATGELLTKTPEYERGFIAARMSADGKVAVLSAGMELIAYDARNGRELYRGTPTDPARFPYLQIMTFAVSSRGTWAIVGVNDGRVFAAELTKGREMTLLTRNTAARQIHLGADDRRLFISSSGSDVLWDWPTRTILTKLDGASRRASMSDDGRYIVRMFERLAEVLDAETGAPLLRLQTFSSNPTLAAFADEYIMVATADGLVEMWHIAKGVLVFRQHHGHHLDRIALASDASMYAVAKNDRLSIYPIRRSDTPIDQVVERLRAVFSTTDFNSRYVLHE